MEHSRAPLWCWAYLVLGGKGRESKGEIKQFLGLDENTTRRMLQRLTDSPFAKEWETTLTGLGVTLASIWKQAQKRRAT